MTSIKVLTIDEAIESLTTLLELSELIIDESYLSFKKYLNLEKISLLLNPMQLRMAMNIS